MSSRKGNVVILASHFIRVTAALLAEKSKDSRIMTVRNKNKNCRSCGRGCYRAL